MRLFLRDCIMVIALVGSILFLLPKPPMYNNNIGYKHHYIVHHADDIKTLIIGHSHFENGLNPHLLGDSVFNLASAGRPYHYDVQILKEYLPTLPNVKVVLFPIRYRLSDSDFFKERFRQGLFEDYYYGWNMMPPKDYSDSFKKPVKFVPHYRKYKKDRLTVDSLGYELDLSTPRHLTEVEAISLSSQSEDDKAVHHLAKMAETCAKHGVRFIVLACPQSDLFLEHVTTDGMENMDKVIAEASKQHPMEYRNYMFDSAFRADTLYRDWTHLNHTGATMFAQRVKEDFGL